ncbi:MAG: hypothetical protein ACKOWD_17775 [Rhodoferax sp.]
MHAKLGFFLFGPSKALLVLCCAILGATTGTNAWAYKVERVCEMTEPTAKKPATKVCKTLLVKPGAEAKADKKEEKKEEKPAPAHH